MTVLNLRSADLWSGLACLALGGLALWVGADYPLGNAGRLGPGYVPRLLAWLLIGIGLVLMLRALVNQEMLEAGFAVRPVGTVLAAVLTFAAVFSWLGLVPAILATVAVSSLAVAENTWRSALAVGAILALFAWALFVKALGLPLPVLVLSAHTSVIPGEHAPQGRAQARDPGGTTSAAAPGSRLSSPQWRLLGRDDRDGRRTVSGSDT